MNTSCFELEFICNFIYIYSLSGWNIVFHLGFFRHNVLKFVEIIFEYNICNFTNKTSNH